jgi:hypothetical protein
MVMKLTWENNKGDKVIVIYDKDCITDKEVELNPNIALDPLFESLKNKITEEYEKKNA